MAEVRVGASLPRILVQAPMMRPVPAFHEEWFPQESQEVLARLVAEVAGVVGCIVEVGSWEGRSSVALARAADPRLVHCVDTWAGSPGEISADLAGRRDVFAQWQANVDHCTRGNCVPHRMGWREWVRDELHGSIALGFIDAEHSYREVYDNTLAFMQRLAPGGILCGDDAHHPPVQQALNELLPGWTREATCWIWRAP